MDLVKNLLFLLLPLVLLSCYGYEEHYKLSIYPEEEAILRAILKENGIEPGKNSIEPYLDIYTISGSSGDEWTGSSYTKEVYKLIVDPVNDTIILSDYINQLTDNFKGIRSSGKGKITTILIQSDSLIQMKYLELPQEGISHIPESFSQLKLTTLDITGNPITSINDALMSTLNTGTSHFLFNFTNIAENLSDTLNRWLNIRYAWPYNSTSYPILDSIQAAAVRKILNANGYTVPADSFVEPYLQFHGYDTLLSYAHFSIPLPAPGTSKLVLNDGVNDLDTYFVEIVLSGDSLQKGPITELDIQSDSSVYIKELNLNYQQLHTLPTSIYLLQVRKFYLQHNKIDTLPEELRWMTRPPVKANPRLYLEHNKLDSSNTSYLMKAWLQQYAGGYKLWETQNTGESYE